MIFESRHVVWLIVSGAEHLQHRDDSILPQKLNLIRGLMLSRGARYWLKILSASPLSHSIVVTDGLHRVKGNLALAAVVNSDVW